MFKNVPSLYDEASIDKYDFSHFRLSPLLIIDVNSILVLLNHVNMNDNTDISTVRVTSVCVRFDNFLF